MKKIKLFTHGADLDGIGCAIFGVFGIWHKIYGC